MLPLSFMEHTPRNHSALAWPFKLWQDAYEYALDTAQRNILMLDVMRQRGNEYAGHMSKKSPNVLSFKYDPIMDGRKLDRPVNYGLVRIIPPEGMEVNESRRPFMVVDPRAGHGPGIGGFKVDSEIGMAIKAGHPCYFVGFLPDPVEGQTILDIAKAEALFLEEIIRRHPNAEGRPCVIGNCQAGWALMMVAAGRPDLFGPIIIAGAPLSYWAGTSGVNPMRYSGGLVGGSWITTFLSDIGQGVFDGAWLVSNFEGLNPANTLWLKPYNLYARIDTETERYLEFERWWGGHVNLNAEEIQYIVDELFIGNKLASASLRDSDGHVLDIRSITSPIVVFCSHGDNITPPPQALGWILDMYDDVDDIVAHGQTIIYTVHDSIGHLGIFVSSKIARAQHDEFASNINVIDSVPPGLYELVMVPKKDGVSNAGLAEGDYVVRFEPRSLQDIRKLGDFNEEDENLFATMARVSDINKSLYHTFMRPFVRMVANDKLSDWLHKTHPARFRYEAFSDQNPFLKGIDSLSEFVRQHRYPAQNDNPFREIEKQISNAIAASLDQYKDKRDSMKEQLFRKIYGNPVLQAFVGIHHGMDPRNKPPTQPGHHEEVQRTLRRLKENMTRGGLPAATMRALIYMAMIGGGADERSFSTLRAFRRRQPDAERMPLEDFKQLIRNQYLKLRYYPEAAMEAIPAMLPDDGKLRAAAIRFIYHMAEVRGPLSAESKERLAYIETLFSVSPEDLEAAEFIPELVFKH